MLQCCYHGNNTAVQAYQITVNIKIKLKMFQYKIFDCTSMMFDITHCGRFDILNIHVSETVSVPVIRY
jgi:hypothetical protein